MQTPVLEVLEAGPRIEFDAAEYEYRDYCWEQLELHPLFCRYYACGPEWTLPSRKLPNAYFTYWESGCADLWLGQRHFKLQGGELVLFGSDELHEIIPIERSSCRMCNLHFKSLLNGTFDLPRQWGLGGVYHCRELVRPEIFLTIPTVLQCREPGGTAYVNALIRAMLYQIAVQHSQPPDRRIPTRMEPALEMIKKRFSDPGLDLARLARSLNVSKVYCRELFIRYCGESPMKYLQRVRLEHAGLMLQTTDVPVKMIAEQCGFNDLNFFHRVFKRVTGEPPGGFRVRMKEHAERRY